MVLGMASGVVSGGLPKPLRFPDGRVLAFQKNQALVMGVINATPDSFSDGGRYNELEAALHHAHELLAEGADILDVGGESTRPGSLPVPAKEQCRRVLPLVRALAKEGHLVSIDTTSLEVARAAYGEGAQIINDISGFTFEAGMLPFLAEKGLVGVAMHTKARPEVMQAHASYEHVVDEVHAFLKERLRASLEAGLPRDKLILDPGLGFGKTPQHTLQLIKHLPRFLELGQSLLLGPSRKSFLGQVTGKEVHEREEATAAAAALCIANGAHIIRVHNPRAVRDAVLLGAAIRDADLP